MHELNRTRDPLEAAGNLIYQLCALCDEVGGLINDGEAFIRDHLDPMYDDNDLDADAVRDLLFPPGAAEGAGICGSVIVSAAFCIHAMRAAKAGDLMGSWSYVHDAAIWFGGACAGAGHAGGYDAFVKIRAQRAAAVRHAEDNEIRDRIYEWWKVNHCNYKSMDKAAEAVTRLEPVGFRTARKHIGAAVKIYALPAKGRSSR